MISVFCCSVDVVYADFVQPCSNSCVPGTYCDNGTCKTCDAGYYCTGGSAGKAGCFGNHISGPGQSSCDVCYGATQYANEEHTFCVSCDTGNYVHDAYGLCSHCPSNKFANETHTQCLACNGVSQYEQGGVCYTCSGATPYVNETHDGCFACDTGPYIGDGGECTKCADGLYANVTHTECVECNGSVEVPDIAAGVCYTCGIGKYIDADGACQLCPAGFKCSGDGTKTQCAGATISASPGASVCTVCDAENDEYANEEHTECVLCTNTAIQYVDNFVCITCGAGTYKDGNKCKTCPVGYKCIGNGQKTACVGNEIAAQSGAVSCESCGQLHANEDHTQCIKCNNGKCVNNNNKCVKCTAGRYCPDEGDSLQCSNAPKCPKGSYSSTGQNKCTLCPFGYTTNTIGLALGENDIWSNICVPEEITLGFEGGVNITLPSCLIPGKINKKILKTN